MTSSYNLSRRPLKQLLSPINWDAYQRQFGVCYGGYATVPIAQSGNCTDWKFCVPLKNNEGMPYSYPEFDAMMNDGGIVGTHSKDGPVVETRHFTSSLYRNPNAPQQSQTNFYPPHKRRVERRHLDKEDYFRLPMKFDGTGYQPVRSWDYPETATDHVELSNEWSPFHLIQRKEVQEQSKRELRQRQEQGFPPYTKPYLGTFYRDY